MLTFLEINCFSREAVEGIVEMLFGDLSPDEAIKLDRDYSGIRDQDKMKLILKHLSECHFKNND